MKGIRGKLFIYIGILLLIVAALNYFIPKIFVSRDIDSASSALFKNIDKIEGKIGRTIAFWVASHFINQITQFETFSKILQNQPVSAIQQKSLWTFGAELIGFNPSLAYVQIAQGEENIAVIAPENGTMYAPLWTAFDNETLLIRLPEKQNQSFIAFLQPHKENAKVLFYALYPNNAEIKSITFKSFETHSPSFSPDASIDELYAYVNWKQNRTITKAEMIQKLAPFQDKKTQGFPVGMLAVSPDFQWGYVLFSDEVFLSTPVIKKTEDKHLMLLERQNSIPYLDVADFMTVSDLNIWLAFSLSSIGEQVAKTLGKPIVISTEKKISILFPPQGTPQRLQAGKLTPEMHTFDWEKTKYSPYTFQLGPLSISILTPTSEEQIIPKLMNHLRETLINKISYNLLIAAIIVLIIALIFLARLSKRITQPIRQLAHASQEIAQGKYETAILPKVKNHENEIAVLAQSFEDMVVALRDREKIRGVLNKFVSKEVASEVLKSNIELGGEERFISLLFCDIRHFTHLSNTLHPKEVIEMLNHFMTQMCQVIDHTQGVVDKFIGDEIMALYGAPLPLENHADKAVEGAIGMMQRLIEWNQKGENALAVGIGIHTGSVCSGNMGGENRLNYTVIGSNVNLASRLCAAAKPMQILISKETKEALQKPEKYPLKQLPPLTLKGFDAPVAVFEISFAEKENQE